MSDFKHYHKLNGEKIANELDNSNGIVNQIKNSLNGNNAILFIASSPDDKEKIELYSKLLFEGLKLSGVSFTYTFYSSKKETIIISFPFYSFTKHLPFFDIPSAEIYICSQVELL